MRKLFKILMYVWEIRKKRREKLQELLKLTGFKLIKDSSITLTCFVKANIKNGKLDLYDGNGNLLHKNITKKEATELMAKYSDEAAKSRKSLDEYLKIKNEAKILRKEVNKLYKNPNFIQTNKVKYRIYEVESAVDLQRKLKGKLRASKKGEAGDFIVQDGKFAGKSVDAMGLYNDTNTLTRWKNNYTDNLEKFKSSIDKHFKKVYFPNANNASTAPLDFVAIDFRYFDDVHPNLRKDVLDYINDSNYIFKDNVINNLIKLNF